MESYSIMKNKMRNAKTHDVVEGKETWIFIDTKCQFDQTISFQWNHLFQVFLKGDYQVFLQYDWSMKLNK